ncbi:hypothetical protein BJF78_16260 [Pseudonocardia sp. CNS-139]|nr:hypothetical protein BJF78_16260 [Pseudonocardia sp. CNS-139]
MHAPPPAVSVTTPGRIAAVAAGAQSAASDTVGVCSGAANAAGATSAPTATRPSAPATARPRALTLM